MTKVMRKEARHTQRRDRASGIWNLGFFPNDARKDCPFVLTAFTGWSSEQARVLEWGAFAFSSVLLSKSYLQVFTRVDGREARVVKLHPLTS